MATHPDWTSLALLGALHGVNPAMGWLFAVSLGLQARSSRAVWSALAPLALGHALAIVAAVGAVAMLGVVMPILWIRWIAAAALLGFGVLHLKGHMHPRWAAVGMRVGAKQLTLWSFIVSSAHGAGLMVLPFVMGSGGASVDTHGMQEGGHAAHLASLAPAADHTAAMAAALTHTAGYLVVAGMIAWVVYARVGLRFLRRAWINMNVIWAVALIVTAVVTPFL